MKRSLTSFFIRETQIKSRMRCSTRMAKIERLTISSVDEDMEQLKHFLYAYKWYNHFENCFTISYEVKHTLTI